MKIILKNTSIVFQSQYLEGWVDVTNNSNIITTSTGSYYNTAGELTVHGAFGIAEIVKPTDSTKVRTYARFASGLTIMLFKDDNDNTIGNPVTMNSEGMGSATGWYTVTKDWPEGATKVLISYSIGEGVEDNKHELYYQ